MKEERPLNLKASFPRHIHPHMRSVQEQGLDFAEKHRSCVLEAPTGTGKTDIGYTVLRAHRRLNEGPLFYIAPTKTLVEQVGHMCPDLRIAYGRSEYDCLYYEGEGLKADEIPCSILIDCRFRVDQQTGETFEPGAPSCPYLRAKYEAKQAPMVVCTYAFYLFTQLFSREWRQPAALIIDEAHRIARAIRSLLSYEITDWHLRKCIELLEEIGAEGEAAAFEQFLKTMVRIARAKPAKTETLLEAEEIRELLDELVKIEPDALRTKLAQAVKDRRIDPRERREALKKLEVLALDLGRYIRSLGYSLATGERHALNYTYAFYREELTERERVRHKLVIRAYYVAPIIRKLFGRITVAYSATIGNPQVFAFETGIDFPVCSLASTFSADNARIFMPIDTPSLAAKVCIRAEPTKVLRRIARACVKFGAAGHRSLVVVVSEKQRQKFLAFCVEEGVHATSYGNGTTAKAAAANFKEGEGTVLVGTVAQYGEGVDLPKMMAPVIFFLKPGFPNPKDPMAVFEGKRFGRRLWELWNWRVMIEALQVRGRNIRSTEDKGVTFFISQQFRRFVFGSLPGWLEPAYRGTLTFDQCVEETLKLLGRR
ncbi:DEAD/DEAH box helicase family protein [Candidatus Parcubacteria bacterium]|nr:DEAD/DEAH box helicase family protein [Candidatus Parcubacteria bacterium]